MACMPDKQKKKMHVLKIQIEHFAIVSHKKRLPRIKIIKSSKRALKYNKIEKHSLNKIIIAIQKKSNMNCSKYPSKYLHKNYLIKIALNAKYCKGKH